MTQRSDPLDALAVASRSLLAWLGEIDADGLLAGDDNINHPTFNLAAQLGDIGELDHHGQTIRGHCETLARNPLDNLPLLPLAATWLAAGRPAEALAAIGRLMARGVDTGDIRLHKCHALLATKSFEEALATTRQMALEFADHLGAIETAALIELLHGEPATTVSLVEGFLARAVTPASATLLGLTVQAALRTGRDLPGLTTQAIAQGSSPALASLRELLGRRNQVQSLWRSFFVGKDVDHADCGIDLPMLKELLSSMPVPTVISVAEGSPGRWNTAIGDPYAFEANGFVLQRWTGVMDRGPMTMSLQERRHLSTAAHRLQEATMRSGRLSLASPFGGTVSSSFATVLHMAPRSRHFGSTIAYYFDEPQPSFALMTTEDHWPLAWYDPVADVIIRHRSIEDHDLLLQDRIRELKQVWLTCPALVRQQRSTSGAARETALLVGLLDYISTHVFTDLQGIQHIIDRGLVSTVSRVIVTGPEPYGPIEQIFPELQDLHIERHDWADEIELNTWLWSNNVLAVRVAGGIVSEALPRRLTTRATLLATPGLKQHADRLLAQHWPLLFVALRTHNRRWTATPSQIAGMLLRIRAVHRRLAVVWDGHSATQAGIPDSVREETALASAVRACLPADLPFLTLVGHDMQDALYAVAVADLHLSAQGTSATKAFLLAGKPGVIIGPRHFGWDVRAFRDPQPAALVPWHEVEDLEPSSETDFALPAGLLAEQLLAVAATLRERPVSDQTGRSVAGRATAS